MGGLGGGVDDSGGVRRPLTTASVEQVFSSTCQMQQTSPPHGGGWKEGRGGEGGVQGIPLSLNLS